MSPTQPCHPDQAVMINQLSLALQSGQKLLVQYCILQVGLHLVHKRGTGRQEKYSCSWCFVCQTVLETANRLLSFCTVIYGNGAQGVLRAWESWCHKVVSERLGKRCPVICVYANDKTKASAAENTHTHTHTCSCVFRTRSFHLFLLLLCLSICNSGALLPPRAPPHCLMQLFSPDRSDQSFLLTSDSIQVSVIPNWLAFVLS